MSLIRTIFYISIVLSVLAISAIAIFDKGMYVDGWFIKVFHRESLENEMAEIRQYASWKSEDWIKDIASMDILCASHPCDCSCHDEMYCPSPIHECDDNCTYNDDWLKCKDDCKNTHCGYVQKCHVMNECERGNPDYHNEYVEHTEPLTCMAAFYGNETEEEHKESWLRQCGKRSCVKNKR